MSTVLKSIDNTQLVFDWVQLKKEFYAKIKKIIKISV